MLRGLDSNQIGCLHSVPWHSTRHTRICLRISLTFRIVPYYALAQLHGPLPRCSLPIPCNVDVDVVWMYCATV